MKSTFKRILALVMVFCTVAAWMIPGVSVSAADNDLSVDFKTSANNASVAASQYFYDQTVVDKLVAAYDTNGWKPYGLVYSVYPARFYGNALALAVRANNANTYQYLPLQFKAPATGDYTVSIRIHSNVNSALTDFRAYVIPVPETAYDKAGLCAVMDAKLSETAPLQYDPTEVTSGYVDGTQKVDLEEGKEYLLVFCTYGPKDGTVLLTSFSLNYQEPEVEETTAPTEATTVPEETVPLGSETIDFTTLGEDLSIAASTQLVAGHTLQTAGTTVNTAYDAETDPYAWGLVSGHRNGLGNVQFAATGLKIISNSSSNSSVSVVGKKIAVALKLRAPGTGKYEVSMEYVARPGNDVADELAMYILPLPESDLFSSELMADGKTQYTYMFANAVNNPSYAVQEMDGTVVGYLNDAVLTTPIQDATMATTNAVRVASGETFEFEANKEYMVVLAIGETSDETALLVSKNSGDKTNCSAEIRKLNFTPYAAEASIAGKYEGTLADALTTAVSGDTIVLGKNVTADELDLPDGVALDINGKTLTANAVVGKVADSADGEGLIAVGKDAAVISAVSGQVVLWDNNVYTPGYRVFSYTQSNYGITAGEDDATGVDEKIHFYDYEAAGLEAGTIEKADSRFRTQLAAIRAAFENGTSNWCMEGSTQTYQFRETAGTNGFSSGTSALYLTMGGSDVYALRFNSPGEGKVGVTIKVGTAPYNKTCATVNYYIVEASKFEEALGENYATLVENWDADAYANATDEWKAALKGLVTGETPVATHTGEKKTSAEDTANYDTTVKGTFEFKADTEYLLVCQQTAGTYLYLKDLNFYRTEKQGMTQTFWSTLKFTNPLAYTLINTRESGLKVGFHMSWNGTEKDFVYSDADLAAWAGDQSANTDKTYGLYIRMSGFETLEESGTLYGCAYVADATTITFAADPMEYNHTV